MSILIVAGAVLVALILLVFVVMSNIVRVPANEAAIITGRGKKRYVTGGTTIKNPLFDSVDRLSLNQMSIAARVEDVPSLDNVPVTVSANGTVKFGSGDEQLANSSERFIGMPIQEIERTLSRTLSGCLRNIVGTMTVEQLNQDRETFKAKVLTEIVERMNTIGVVVDSFDTDDVVDKNGYINALGARRIAEVKSEAEIAIAKSDSETRIAQAKHKQAGDLATFTAETETRQAQQARDLELARLESELEQRRAQTAQAGPIAAARAQQELVEAQAEVEARQTRAQLAVEDERAQLVERQRRIDVIDRARAEAEAAQLLARSEADAAIITANGTAEANRLQAKAEADAAIEAIRAQLAEQKALAEGTLAQASADAEGKKLLADALKQFGTEAQAMQLQQLLIPILPELIRAAAGAFDKVGSITVFDGGSGNGISSIGSQAIKVMDLVKTAVGIDIAAFLRDATGSTTAPQSTDASVASVPSDDALELVSTNHSS